MLIQQEVLQEIFRGTINNKDRGEGDYYCVYNLDHVTGKSYAGGFGGNVYSGALASAGKVLAF